MSRRFSRRRMRFGGPPVFTPTSLSGLVLWLRADLGITLNGSNVSAWADQSGTGDSNKNVTQGTAANQPAFTSASASFNSRPVVSFDGVDDFMVSTTWSAAMPAVCTWVVVGRALGTDDAYMDGIGNRNLIRREVAGVLVYSGVGFTAGVSSATSQVLVAILNGASSKLYQSAVTEVGSGNAGSDSLAGMTLGQNISGAGSALSGDIAEAIGYNRILTQSEVNSVLSYAGSRYGITIGA